MTSETKMVITKVGDTPKHKNAPAHRTKKANRGILKLKGVRDPAKAPPLKRGMRKHTLRLLTEKGMRKHRRTQKNRISKMKPDELKATLGKSIGVNPNTPPEISRQILDNAVSAGFISLP